MLNIIKALFMKNGLDAHQERPFDFNQYIHEDDRDVDYAGVSIRLEVGSITDISADAIVNSANRMLMPGGGVDGAIHKAAGASLKEELKQFVNGCEEGKVVVTSAYNLPATHIIHTVTPVYSFNDVFPVEKLRSCYHSIFQAASELNCSSIAIPAIGSGVNEFPIDISARIAKEEYRKFFSDNESSIKEVVFVLFDISDYEKYKEEFECFSLSEGKNEKPQSEYRFFSENRICLDGDFVVSIIPSATNVASVVVDARETEPVHYLSDEGVFTIRNLSSRSIPLFFGIANISHLKLSGNGQVTFLGGSDALFLELIGNIEANIAAYMHKLSIKADGVGSIVVERALVFEMDITGEFDCIAEVEHHFNLIREGFGDIKISGSPQVREIVDNGVGALDFV